jgi:hypothetical protein
MSRRNRLSRLESRVPERHRSIFVVTLKPGETSADATARAAAERGRRAESFSRVTLVEFVSPVERPAREAGWKPASPSSKAATM